MDSHVMMLSVAHPIVHAGCHVIDVHDGDTMRVDIAMHYRSAHMPDKLRLAHVNAPELATAAGTHAKAFVVNWLADRSDIVTVTTYETKAGDTIVDNYGRPLAVLTDSAGVSLNQALLDAGQAVPYEGGAK